MYTYASSHVVEITLILFSWHIHIVKSFAGSCAASALHPWEDFLACYCFSCTYGFFICIQNTLFHLCNIPREITGYSPSTRCQFFWYVSNIFPLDLLIFIGTHLALIFCKSCSFVGDSLMEPRISKRFTCQSLLTKYQFITFSKKGCHSGEVSWLSLYHHGWLIQHFLFVNITSTSFSTVVAAWNPLSWMICSLRNFSFHWWIPLGFVWYNTGGFDQRMPVNHQK